MTYTYYFEKRYFEIAGILAYENGNFTWYNIIHLKYKSESLERCYIYHDLSIL